jgi:glycosyltransferase involved in cell wall biosynthesis
MKIVIINKEILQNRPPVLSTLLTLSDLGHEVSIVSVDINEYWRKELDERIIKYYVIPDKTRRNRFSKILEYLNFKKKAFEYLDQVVKDKQGTLVWLIGGNTIYCLGDTIKNYRYVLQIQELHEKNNNYKRIFSKIINNAEVVFVNEYNRAVLYQCWYDMKKRPVVIPNKPYFIDTDTAYDLSEYVDIAVIEKIKNSKVLLFQGQIVSYRDLSPYIRAAKELGDYQIVLLGNEYGMVEKYKQIDNTLIYIKRIPAPQYLGITALSHICLITYDPRSLNNSYCAPNKIYEYGAFGKPMIGNDIPGLRVIEDFHAGCLVDEDRLVTIKTALQRIEDDYHSYSVGAKQLYDGVDNKSIIASVLNSL